MATNDFAGIIAYLVMTIFGIAALLVFSWLACRMLRLIRILLEIHGATARQGPGYRLPFWAMFDPVGLSQKEKALRAEAMAGLGPIMLTFLGFFCVVILLVTLTSYCL